MVDIKKSIWLFPLIGGIVAIVSILSPASYYIEDDDFLHVWMCGLAITRGDISFSEELDIMIIGNLFTFLILIPSIIMLIAAFQVRKGKHKIDDFENFWILSGLLVILSSIAWIISIDSIPSVGSIEWWDTFDLGFGVIGPFITGSLVILAVCVNRFLIKEK